MFFQYDNLDKEHKDLFQGVFGVAADKSSKAALKKLCDVAENHFKDEEVKLIFHDVDSQYVKSNGTRPLSRCY